MKIATARTQPERRSAKAEERASVCARVANDRKARDIQILDMRGITPLFDYVVLATGVSRRQLHALAEDIDDAMKGEGDKRLGIEGYEASKWIVLDYGDVVVHLFDSETRGYYGLEDLWADAPRVNWE